MRALFISLCVLAVVTSAQQIRQQRGQVADQDQVLLQDENLDDQQQGIITEQPAVIEQQQPGVIRQQQPIVQQRQQQQQPVIQQQQPVIQQQPVRQQRGQRGQQQQQQRRQQPQMQMQEEEDTVIIPIPTDLVNKWTTMLFESIKIDDPITMSAVIDNSTEIRYDTLLPFGGSYFGVEGFWEYFLKCIMTRKITDLNYDILGSDTSRGTSLVRLTWSADFLDTSESSGEWTGMNQQRQGRQQQQQQGFQQQQQQPLVQQQQPIVEQQQQQPIIQNQPIQQTRAGRGLLQQRRQQQGVLGQQRQQRGQQRVGQQQQRSIQDQESMCVLKWNIASGSLKHFHCFDMEQQELLNSFFKRGERLGFSFLDRFFRSGILTEDSPVFDLVSQDALLNINMLPIGGLQQTSFSGPEEWLNFFQLLDKQMSATCNPEQELEFANQPSAFEQQGSQQQSRQQQQQGGVRQQSQQQRRQGRQLLQQRRGQQQQQTPVVQQQQPVVQQPVVQQQQPVLSRQQDLGMQQTGQQSDVLELLQRPEAQAMCHVALRALNKLMMAESSAEVLFSDDNSLVLHIKNDIFGNAEGTVLMRLLFNEQDLLQQLDLSFSKVLMPWQISPFPLTQSQSRLQQQPRQQQRQGVAQPVRQQVRQTQPIQTSQTVQQQPAVIEQQPQEQVNVQQQPTVVRQQPVAGQQQQRVTTPVGQPTRRQGGQ